MRVLIGCETSGVVRRAFAARGHDVWSCDVLPAQDGSNRHIRCDIRDILHDGWELMAVMHPPCTRLCNSGVRWLHSPPRGRTRDEMWAELRSGAALFSDCWNAPIPRIAMENPIMHQHAKALIHDYQPPAQTIQPWHFGEPAFKATSFYLRRLPLLTATRPLTPPAPGTEEHKAWSWVHRAPPTRDRWQRRSRTFAGIAEAMADQWGRAALDRAEGVA